MHRTLPYSAYSSEAVLQQERSHLFANSWQYVGHTGDFGEHLTTIPIVVNGLPIVLTRDEDEFRAFVNVCAHRGSIACKQSSESRSITCPYHAWRYGLDGSLIKAPRSERESDFDISEFSLESLPFGRWGPLLFVGMSSQVMDFEEFLGDLPDHVKRAGIDLDSVVFHSRAAYELAANWKICSENFLECYHCRVAHPDFAKAIDTSPDNYELVAAPTFSTQYGPVRSTGIGLIDLAGAIERSQFHLLYPNTAINIMPGEPNLSIGPILPIAPTRTSRFLDYFFGVDTPSEWIESMLRFDDKVGSEDKVLVEDMQIGLSARPDRMGTLFMDSERLISHFEAHLEEHVNYTG